MVSGDLAGHGPLLMNAREEGGQSQIPQELISFPLEEEGQGVTGRNVPSY